MGAVKVTESSKQNISASTQFIEDLQKEALSHRALNHPLIDRLKAGDFKSPRLALEDFFYQYLAYSKNFLRFLTATVSQLERLEHRAWLLDNLLEESGHVAEEEAKELRKIGVEMEWIQGVAHPILYQNFLTAIGKDEDYQSQHGFCPESTEWSQKFLKYCQTSSAEQAVGAMGLGTENIVKHIYWPLLEAIKTHLNISSKDRVFFDLHALLDDEHGKIFDRIAGELGQTKESQEQIRAGMLKALDLRAEYFDAMLKRAEGI